MDRARVEALFESMRDHLFLYAFWISRDREVADEAVRLACTGAGLESASRADEHGVRSLLISITRREVAKTEKFRNLRSTDGLRAASEL
jgi:DNA-directed RNA polymerase specialized sigma24 family protein